MTDDIYNIATEKFGPAVQENSTELKFCCPKCDHNALIVSISLGIFHCFICHYGRGEKSLYGNTVHYAKRNINLDLHGKVRQFIIDNTDLSSYNKEYLRGRGIYNPEKYKLRTIPSNIDYLLSRAFNDEELLASGFFKIHPSRGLSGWPCLKFNRIFIPLMDNGNITACKTRRDPRLDLSDSCKYSMPYGVSIDKAVGYYPTNSQDDLCITEGDLKGMAGHEIGESVLLMSGINAIKAAFNFFLSNKPGKRNFVIFDNEAYDPDYAKLESRVQALILCKHIGEECAIVRLPKRNPILKMDWDTYLVEEGEQEFYRLKEDAWKNRAAIRKDEEKALYKGKEILF